MGDPLRLFTQCDQSSTQPVINPRVRLTTHRTLQKEFGLGEPVQPEQSNPLLLVGFRQQKVSSLVQGGLNLVLVTIACREAQKSPVDLGPASIALDTKRVFVSLSLDPYNDGLRFRARDPRQAPIFPKSFRCFTNSSSRSKPISDCRKK